MPQQVKLDLRGAAHALIIAPRPPFGASASRKTAAC